MLLFSENSNYLIQNIAFDIFLHKRLVASVNEPEGLNNIPRYLYSVQYSKALLLKINLSLFIFLPDLLKIITLLLSKLTVRSQLLQYKLSLSKHLCKPLDDSEIRTKSSAYKRQDILLSFNWVGSQLSSKINGKSLIYKENSVGVTIHPCFTPTLEWKKISNTFP